MDQSGGLRNGQSKQTDGTYRCLVRPQCVLVLEVCVAYIAAEVTACIKFVIEQLLVGWKRLLAYSAEVDLCSGSCARRGDCFGRHCGRSRRTQLMFRE